jgi:alpha-beta hydrolase superfamily lysophospholipase
MPGTASSLRRVIQKAIDADETVKAFVYDNKFHSLEESSRDLAHSIEESRNDRGDRPLRIIAHSAGGRVALGSLAILENDGRLTGDIELDLIASPIAGVKSATFARLAPNFIPWIRPLRGISPSSRFQKVIDRLRLPDNVKVNIFVGGQDSVFNYSTTRYSDLVERLHATFRVFAQATHTSILDELARLPETLHASDTP